MGVALDLRLIDHQRIVVDGLPVVNEAIERNDAEILRRYLATLPVEVNDELVAEHRSRLAQLRKMKTPKEIIQIADQSLRRVTGEPYRPSAFAALGLDELRELFGTWCWMNYSFSLDKVWNELNWFMDPLDGTPEPPHFPMRPRVGDPRQSISDKAIHGSQPYPSDVSGQPIIRTLGSKQADCTGYNPPDEAKAILAALNEVDTSRWADLLPRYVRMYRQAMPSVDVETVNDIANNELQLAQETFSILKAAYARAVEKSFGVSCEFSL